MSSEPTVPIDDVQDGQIARISGTVRALGETRLTAPVSGRSCVYFEVCAGLVAATPGDRLDQQGQNFLLQDGAGRALVVMDRCEVVVGADDQQVPVRVLEADIHELSRSLRELKQAVRRGPPSQQRQLHRRLRQEKALATWLCAMRAHERRKLHHGRNLEEQERFIRERRAEYEEQGTRREVSSRHLDRYDLVIQSGAEIVVAGLCHWEPDPDPGANAVGYRQRAQRLVVRAPPDGPLRVWADPGVDDDDARENQARAERAVVRKRRARLDTVMGCLVLSFLALLAGGAIWWILS